MHQFTSSLQLTVINSKNLSRTCRQAITVKAVTGSSFGAWGMSGGRGMVMLSFSMKYADA